MTVIVRATGPLSLIQDLGRTGYAHVGVPNSGAADREAHRLANRLVGNQETAATIETTFGGLHLTSTTPVLVSVTGAPTTVLIDGTPVGINGYLTLPAGGDLHVAAPTHGARNYVAVRGGFGVPPVLGSRSTDTLTGLGPAPLTDGTTLPIGNLAQEWPPVMTAPTRYRDHDGERLLEIIAGPRAEHLANIGQLTRGLWEVTPDSNRVGLRLRRSKKISAGEESEGVEPRLVYREDATELASEGVPHGAIQVPPEGNPVLFLADHPVTGGYPVVALLTPSALDMAAQLTAGMRVRFHFG